MVGTSLVAFAPADIASAESESDGVAEQTVIDDPNYRPKSVEALTARVEMPKGATIVAGHRTTMDVVIHNTGFDDARNVGVRVKVPNGVAVRTKTEGWSCGARPGPRGYTCTRARTLANESSTDVKLILATTRDTAPSRSHVLVTPITTTKKTVTAKSVALTVLDFGDPLMVPQVQHRDKKNKKWEDWTDGGHVSAYVNEDYSYRIVVRNQGVDRLKRGSRIVVTQKVDKDTGFDEASIARAGGWCTTKLHLFTCHLYARKDVAPGAVLGEVDVLIKPKKVEDEIGLGPVVVVNPESGARKTTRVKLRAEVRPEGLVIHAHPTLDPDAGGKGEFTLRLENKKNGLDHRSVVMHSLMPKGIVYEGVTGRNWTCAMTGRHLRCDYRARLAPRQKSSVARITYRAASSARTEGDPYTLEFRSAHAASFLHIHVSPALKVVATATPSRFIQNEAVDSHPILLSGEQVTDLDQSFSHEWVQRCTTAADTVAYEGCTRGVVTPKARIAHKGHSRTHARVPDVTRRTVFVFEYIGRTKSMEAHETVKVTVHPAGTEVSGASVRASGVSGTGVREAATTGAPQWVLDALNMAKIPTANVVSANGVIGFKSTTLQTRDALPDVMRSTLYMRDTIPVQLSGAANDQKTCLVLTVGDQGEAKTIGRAYEVGLEIHYMEYIVAPSLTASCKYHGTSYKGINMRVTGPTFGSQLTFDGPVSWTPGFKYNGSHLRSTWSLGSGAATVTMKDIGMQLEINALLNTVTLGYTASVPLFGTQIAVSGAVRAPAGIAGTLGAGMMATLTMGSPQDFHSGEVHIRNLALTFGVTWSGTLNANAKWYDTSTSQVFYTYSASGDIEFLGTTMHIDNIGLAYRSGMLSDVTFRMTTDMNIPGMKTAHGELSLIWMQAIPALPNNTDLAGRAAPLPAQEAGWLIDASVIMESEAGWKIGTFDNPARLIYSKACVDITGQVVVPGMLDATVHGVLVTGFPCGPAIAGLVVTGMNAAMHPASVLDTLPMPLVAGDWRFDATNVKINIAGTTVEGNFSIGKVLGAPFGAIDATLHLGKSDTKNTIVVEGAVNPITGSYLKGTGNIDVGGFELNVKVDAAMTVTSQYIHASADVKVAGTSVALSGDFWFVKNGDFTVPTAKFTAEIDGFTIDGYGLGHASFSLTEGLKEAGMSASLDVNLGFLKAEGSATFHTVPNGVAMDVHATGSLKVDDKFAADVSVSVSNCADLECSRMGALKVTATGDMEIQKKVFHLPSVEFDSNGHFKVTLKYADDSCDRSGNIGGVQWEGCFKYRIDALISDRAPYLDLKADAALHVKSRTRDTIRHRWRGWDNWGTVSGGIDVSFDPFHLHLRVGSIRVSFDGK